MGIPEKIKAIQDEIHRTQLNKATEHHIGLLKAKIAKLKREQESIAIKKSSKKSDGFDVKRTGDATVVFIGLPSVGKSTLLNKLTGSKSAIGAFQFTTLTVVPGVLEHRGARIQMLDLPGIIKGASSGKGLGRRILSVARSADIVLLVLDVFQPYHENVLINELNNIGIRLNQEPPNIVIEKSTTGGIAVAQQVKLKKMSEKLLKDILNVYGYTSARVVIREDIDSDQLVDFITGNKTYAHAITILNKIDLVDEKFLKNVSKNLASHITNNVRLVELGSGSSTKTRLLIDGLFQSQKYVEYFPIDVSDVLIDSAKELCEDYRNLKVTGIIDTYENGLDFIESYDDKPNLIIFLGSSFGNFSKKDGNNFLTKIHNLMKSSDYFLMGVDLKKDTQILHNAYNDTKGITKKFNLNVLERINKELDGNFKISEFIHEAHYNDSEGRIEMYLRSRSDQLVNIPKSNLCFELLKNELIHTENSYKFHISQIESLFEKIGFDITQIWFDSKKYFGLILAKKF